MNLNLIAVLEKIMRWVKFYEKTFLSQRSFKNHEMETCRQKFSDACTAEQYELVWNFEKLQFFVLFTHVHISLS